VGLPLTDGTATDAGEADVFFSVKGEF